MDDGKNDEITPSGGKENLRTYLHDHVAGAQHAVQLLEALNHNPVISNRVRKQVSAEDTFPDDIPLAECEPHIRRLAEKVWNASQANARRGRTIALKLKTKEFSSLTRSLTPPSVPTTCEDFTNFGLHLCTRVDPNARQLYRLVGIGLSNFEVEGDVEPEVLLSDSLSSGSITGEAKDVG